MAEVKTASPPHVDGIPRTLQRAAPSPTSKLPLPVEDMDPHLIGNMLPWANPTPQPKRHLDRFSRFCRAHDRNRQTDRTDHATPSVTTDRTNIRSTAMRYNNNKSSAVAEMGDRGHNRHGPKTGGLLCPFPAAGGAGSPSNTMWSGLTSTSVPSGILIHPAVWPQ